MARRLEEVGSIALVERALGDIRKGKMVVLTDDEDRENEGDLVMAAAKVTPAAVNFMATHGRGLICLSLTDDRLRQLNLPLMVHDNTSPFGRQRLAAVQRNRAVSAESYFQRHAAEWDAIRSLHIPETEVERAIHKLLPKRHVGDLLDIGTGTGRMLQLCASSVERAVGVDMSREMLAVARANLDGPEYRNCSLRRAPAENLPFADASFDVVLSHMVLHFLADPERAITEAARVLRPRGRLILVDFAPHDATLLGADHAHRWPGFSDERVSGWLKAAGLVAGRPVSLPGSALTVKLWRGERPEPIEAHVPATRAEPNLELFL